jgi:sialidase-1
MPAQRTIFTDTFQGSDGTLLTAHTSDSGATYAPGPMDAGTATIQLDGSGRVRRDGSGNAHVIASVLQGGTAVEVVFTLHRIGTQTTSRTYGVTIAGSGSAQTHYEYRYNGNGDLQVYSRLAGAATLIGSYTLGTGTGTNVIRCVKASGYQALYVDGTLRISGTNAEDADESADGRQRVGLIFLGATADTKNTTGCEISGLTVNAGWESSEIWRQDSKGGPTTGYYGYRVPSLIRSGDYLVAAAEARIGSIDDTAPKDIVVRRVALADFGATGMPEWSADIVVDGRGTSIADKLGNPCFIHDPSNGRLHLFYTRYPVGVLPTDATATGTSGPTCTVWRTYSDDDGATWAAPIDITTQVKDAAWSSMTTGPGNGVAVASGRLVLSLTHREADTVLYAHAIYSDDHGEAWNQGAEITPGLAAQEVSLAVVPTNRIVATIRRPGDAIRQFAESDDEGATWTERDESEIPDVNVSNGLYSLYGDGLAGLITTHPNSSSVRIDPMIRYSVDGGLNWSSTTLPAAYIPGGPLLDRGGCGYSAIAYHHTYNDLIILFERGTGVDPDTLYAAVAVYRVPVAWMDLESTAPPYTPAGTRPRQSIQRYLTGRRRSAFSRN